MEVTAACVGRAAARWAEVVCKEDTLRLVLRGSLEKLLAISQLCASSIASNACLFNSRAAFNPRPFTPPMSSPGPALCPT